LTKIIEIPVLITQPRQAALFFGDLDFKQYSAAAGFKYAVYDVSKDLQAYFYLLEDFLESMDLSVYDRIIPKAPFVWMLFEYQNKEFDRLIEKYSKYYSTPFFKTAPHSSGDFQNENDEPNEDLDVLYYDSHIDDPVRQILKLSLDKYQYLDFSANSTFAG